MDPRTHGLLTPLGKGGQCIRERRGRSCWTPGPVCVSHLLSLSAPALQNHPKAVVSPRPPYRRRETLSTHYTSLWLVAGTYSGCTTKSLSTGPRPSGAMSDSFSELLFLELLLRSPAPSRFSANDPRDRLLFSLGAFMTLSLLPTFQHFYSRALCHF